MADAITALVAEKRAVGYKYAAEERVLARFAAFCCAEFPGLDAPSQASVEAWVAAARQRGVTPATLQTLAAPVRELARWLGRRGVPAYVLPAGVLPRPARYVPHIYTDAELAALFSPNRPLPLLLGGPVPPPGHAGAVPHDLCLRPACLRSPPAARRRRRHRHRCPADPGREGRQRPPDARSASRFVPGSPTTTPRSSGAPAGSGSSPARPAAPLTLGNIDKNFRRFLWQARISHGGRGHGPRVHDLRHTFAVNNLRAWFARGDDVGALLPVLQAYMGHSSPDDTAYYLRLTAESYPHITAQVQRVVGDVVPPVTGGPRHGD